MWSLGEQLNERLEKFKKEDGFGNYSKLKTQIKEEDHYWKQPWLYTILESVHESKCSAASVSSNE